MIVKINVLRLALFGNHITSGRMWAAKTFKGSATPKKVGHH